MTVLDPPDVASASNGLYLRLRSADASNGPGGSNNQSLVLSKAVQVTIYF